VSTERAQQAQDVDAIPTLAWSAGTDGSAEFLNRRWLEYTGLSAEEALDWGWTSAVHTEDRDRLLEFWRRLLDSGEAGEIEARLRRYDGDYRWFLFRVEPVHDNRGRILKWYGANTDIEDRKRAEALLAAEKRTLEMIASGACLADILEKLCETIDAQAGNVKSTVMLMDADGVHLRHAAGPRVPKGWVEAITPLKIGPCVGSCGSAAFLKQRVIVSDIAKDPLWADRGELALSYGLRAAWSQPLLSRNSRTTDSPGAAKSADLLHRLTPRPAACALSKDQRVLGTFGMYYPEARAASETDLRLIEGAAHIAVIAIEGERSQEALRSAFEEIRNSEARLRKIIDTIPTLAWCSLPDGTGIFWNRRWHEYTGLAFEAVRGWGWQDAIHPEDLKEITDKWLGFLASGQAGEVEGRLRRFDGVYRWFLFRAEPLRDEAGNIVNWYGTDTDIDDLKRAEAKLRQDEEELRRNERELRQLIDCLPQHVLVLDKDGTLLQANNTLLDYTGLTLEEMKGAGTRERLSRDVHPEDLERFEMERSAGLSKEGPFEMEKRLLGKDGRYRWFLVRCNPVLNENGEVVRWFGTATDIEDRKQAENRVRNENVALREEIEHSSMFEEIVGSSEALRRVLGQVSKVAPTDATVLISGETGTGKELVARAIHSRSNRSTRAFIRVNCAAISPSLIASELFGHERGSFTGAHQRRLGRFESADGGTIFLDEVGEIPPETQVALLRVLQEHEFERVGGNQTVSVDVRVLAATNKDLRAAVANGTFRQDLFYRLNVFPIHVPALRDRVDDIPLLVEYLVDRYAKKAGKRIRSVSKKTLDLFQGYYWPGNIRELQNVVERAVVLCEGEIFCVDPSWLAPAPSGPTSPNPTSPDPTMQSIPLVADLAERERALIQNALREAEGLISGPNGAATKLGIPRQTLESKIRKLGINRHRFRTS
jgi:PAS domain S-box-containing protein